MKAIKRLLVGTPGKESAFEVEYDETTTVLDALEMIRHGGERSLKYRHSCHHGSCGTCGAVINGKEALMCLERLDKLEGDTITIAPLGRFTFIGDVAVHPARLYDSMVVGARSEDKEATYLRESRRDVDLPVPPDTSGRTRFEDCIECGLCTNACPVSDSFLGPQSLAQISRGMENNPESRDALLDLASGNDGATKCERHLACSRVCPTGVMPAKHIQLLKNALAKR